MRARVIKGRWSWLGVMQHVGDILDQPEWWIANREADGLVERIVESDATPDEDPDESQSAERIETASTAPSETAMTSTPRASAKKR